MTSPEPLDPVALAAAQTAVFDTTPYNGGPTMVEVAIRAYLAVLRASQEAGDAEFRRLFPQEKEPT